MSTTITINEVKKNHILIFPFMAQGHTIPLLHLATFLSTHHHLHVTIITTSGNAPSLRLYLPSSIHLSILPFPSSSLLPAGVESTDLLPSIDLHPVFVATTAQLRPHLHHLFHSLHLSNSLPLCLISDFFLPWTLDVCRLFSVPRLVFHGMSTFPMFICKSLSSHQLLHSFTSSEDLIHVPGTPPLLMISRHHIPDALLNSCGPNDPATLFLAELAASEINSWGIIVNSFSFIERQYTKLFESFYQNGARAWLVGPLSLLSPATPADEGDCLRWLNGKKRNSVVYVAFGTQTHLTVEQLEEVADGLEAAECEYLWVMRDASWRPPERIIGERGMIVRWAPQRAVLQHETVGGFVSHCGWNSVLESMVAGVPVLTWPMIAEQGLNEKMIVDELGAGLRLRKGGGILRGLVKREEIREGVRELMVGEKGKRVREKMEELGRMAKEAVGDGGTSHKSLSELIDELRSFRNKRDDGLEMEKVPIDADSLFEYQDGIKIS